MHYLVTGANRGIGLELVRQLLTRKEHVVATARSLDQADALQKLERDFGDTLTLHALDVSDDASIAKLASAVGTLDVLINNAGVGSKDDVASFAREEALSVYATNAVAPLLVTRALAAVLRKSKHGKVMNISSRMGSIADNSSGGSVAYRMSKAALNMATKCLALEYAKDGIVIAAMHPGWVKTDMGGKGAPVETPDSATGILKVIDGLTPAAAGTLIDYQGKTLPF